MSLRKTILLGALVSSLSMAAMAGSHGNDKVSWSYQGNEGPEFWGKLSSKFSTCSSGVNQSPVDITTSLDADLLPLQLNYKKAAGDILNNGHTIQLNYAAGSSLKIDGQEYELKQFHFHAPSENQINGKSYPFEAHLVHADDKGNLAVVGVMFEEGEANAVLSKAWEKMPEQANSKNTLSEPVNVAGMLPENQDYYRFNGSLTTPPCSEGVLWLVMKNPVTASKEQIERFTKILHHPNNRPVQPHNARAILH